MLEATLLIAVIVSVLLALHAADAARRTRQELKALQEETHGDSLRLHAAVAQQDERVRTALTAVVELRDEVEVARLAVIQATAPPPPEDLPTPRAVSG